MTTSHIKGVFGIPFLYQPSALFSFADRTISLLAVLLVEGMTVFAKRLSAIYGRERRTVFEGIFTSGDGFQMRRVNARSVAANVIYHHSIRNVAVDAEPSDPVCASRAAAEMKGAVSVFIERCIPDMAIANDGPFGFKPSRFIRRQMVHVVKAFWMVRKTYTEHASLSTLPRSFA